MFRALGEEVLHRGPVVQVSRTTVAGPDGSTFVRERSKRTESGG